MIEVENTDVNIVRNLIPMRNDIPASAYGLKAISDWFLQSFFLERRQKRPKVATGKGVVTSKVYLCTTDYYGNTKEYQILNGQNYWQICEI